MEIQSEFRAIVLNGRVRLTYEKRRPTVIGDGVRSIRELYAEAEAATSGIPRPSRGLLKEFDRVPAKGETVLLQWQHNLCRGAEAIPVPKDHPRYDEIHRLAVRTAKALDLGFASVDVIDVAGETKLMVLEVNAGVMMENYVRQRPEDQETCHKIYEDAVCLMFGIE